MTNAQRVNEILSIYGKQIGNHKDLGVHGYIKNRLNRWKKFLSQEDAIKLADIMITDLTGLNKINVWQEFYRDDKLLTISGETVLYEEKKVPDWSDDSNRKTWHPLELPIKWLPCIQAAAKVYGGR